MARLSTRKKNQRRLAKAKKYVAYRKELREKMVDLNASPEDRLAAQVKLQKLPRDTSIIRVKNRCLLTGRSGGVLRKFMLSRLKFREMALRGQLPGVTKASW